MNFVKRLWDKKVHLMRENEVFSMSFYDRYAECCKQVNILPGSQEAADCLGCSKSYISKLAVTGANPGGDIVKNAAKMLGVSADYLLELTDVPVALGGNVLFTDEMRQAVGSLHTFSDEGLEAVTAMLKTLAETGVLKK